MPPSPHSRSLHRRVFLAGAGATGVAAVGGLAALRALSDSSDEPDAPDGNSSPTAVDPGDLQLITGDASHPGRVTVATADGRELVHFDGYLIPGTVGTGAATTTSPDASSVNISYEASAEGWAMSVAYRATGGTVTADWEFHAPEDADLSNGRTLRTLVDAAADVETHVPATRWTRNPRGGVPYLERVTENHFVDWVSGDSRISGVITVTGSGNNDAYGINTPPTRGDDGVWRASVNFRADLIVAEARDLLEAARPMLAGAVLGHPDLPEQLVDVRGPSTYNIFADAGTRTFTVGIAGMPVNSTAEVVARDYDGVEVHRSTVEVTVPEDARHGDATVDIDLPDERNWYCLDVSCGDAFARTTAAVWPEFEYGPADGSIVGLGGFSAIQPGARAGALELDDDEQALWHRLGIRHLRNPWLTADQSSDHGIRTGIQPSGSAGKFSDPDAESFDDWAGSALAKGSEAGVELFELLNEWNTDKEKKTEHATEYTDKWLKPFRTAMDRDGTEAALISQGLAGWDPGFLNVIRERGGWELLDGIAVHPGRGNYTADYDSQTWNFLGQVRKARAYLDGHPGPTQLWLTEVYACTQPNSWWNDAARTAADAVFLTLPLAKASGVTGVHWYQLNDGLWFDRFGMNPDNSEYYYGLFHVDRSPKPAAVAFAHAAEVLDGASFLGWIESPHPDLRGLRFSRDGETLWVLWSRQDGYITNADHTDDGFYPFPEPWEVPDTASLQVGVPDGVRCTDVIGREVPVDNGSVTVTGSPVVITGLPEDAPTGPEVVDGDMSVALTGVSVRRDGTSLVVDGDNSTGGTLALYITGRQVDGEVPTKEIEIPEGGFSESVDLGDAMPPEEGGEGASTLGVNPGQPPQVRVHAGKSSKLTPESAQTQVWRAEYYRSV